MKPVKLFGLLLFLGWIGISVFFGTERIILIGADAIGISPSGDAAGYVKVVSGLLAYFSMFAVVHPKLKVQLPKKHSKNDHSL
ncbi:MAG: hypothetical protein ACFBZ8_09575 [Opitutales bacterium]